MATLKPNKPSTFTGKRDEYAVRTWIYQVKQYLTLIQVGNSQNLDDPTKISFAATFFSGTAAAWWFTRVASNTVPNTWDAFENCLIQEFVPFDSVQCSRDKLRRLVQRYTVSTYLSEFRNIILTIPGISEGEQVDRFCQGLKPQIRLEVMKAGAQTMNDASRIALNVDAALHGAGMYGMQNGFNPTPMEIGNYEQKTFDRSKRLCYRCHKAGCKPSICGKGRRNNTKNPSLKISNVKTGPGSAGSISGN